MCARACMCVHTHARTHTHTHARVHAQSCLILCDRMDCTAGQAPLSMELSRQEYWSGLPFYTPGNLSDPEQNLCLCVSCIGRQILYVCWSPNVNFLCTSSGTQDKLMCLSFLIYKCGFVKLFDKIVRMFVKCTW